VLQSSLDDDLMATVYVVEGSKLVQLYVVEHYANQATVTVKETVELEGLVEVVQ